LRTLTRHHAGSAGQSEPAYATAGQATTVAVAATAMAASNVANTMPQTAKAFLAEADDPAKAKPRPCSSGTAEAGDGWTWETARMKTLPSMIALISALPAKS
jgi:hypothetical protein